MNIEIRLPDAQADQPQSNSGLQQVSATRC